MKNLVLLLLCLPALGGTVRSPEVTFLYQKLTEPFDSAPCQFEMSPTNPFDRTVRCELNGVRHEFDVHLMLSFYPKSNEGGSAYELLYWVTDLSEPKPKHDSHTLWFHNENSDDRARVIESSVGIEDDNAYLRMKIRLSSAGR